MAPLASGNPYDLLSSSPDSAIDDQDEVFAGRIMWLPRKAELGALAIPGLATKDYDRPVVVLSREKSDDGNVRVCMITTLNNSNLMACYPANKAARASFLPIEPSAPHPDNQVLLRYASDSPRLGKNSYVKTNNKATFPGEIPWHVLREPRRSPSAGSGVFRLSAESYSVLVEKYRRFNPRATVTSPVKSPSIKQKARTRQPLLDTRDTSLQSLGYGGTTLGQDGLGDHSRTGAVCYPPSRATSRESVLPLHSRSVTAQWTPEQAMRPSDSLRALRCFLVLLVLGILCFCVLWFLGFVVLWRIPGEMAEGFVID